MAENRQSSSTDSQRAWIGAGLLAAAGAATFLLARRTADLRDGGATISDAPDHVLRRGEKADESLIGRSVTVNKPRPELYAEWRNFTRFPRFMDNVERVEDLGEGRSRWTIKAPAGTGVELVTRITEDRAGEAIAWESEPESDITTQGRVEFTDAGPGRGTMVRLTMHYDPPGGAAGRLIAKIFQREPNMQARRDLRRFKQLMETGEVTTNASPSGRKSEAPTEARI
ncbi:MAG: SRPBCC family protein [Pseudomonadota bacterium]|nr:SRPBCC family protein [Pseudomonadota bacterium]